MKTKTKVPVHKTLGWGLNKFGRWFRIYRHIVQMVHLPEDGSAFLMAEKELGGGLDPY